MNLLLERFCYTPLGTVGRMTVDDGVFKCYTIERPWLENALFISCIPTGEYTVKLGVFYKRGYPAWEIMDVPGRTDIKIHRANTMLELEGCIALGTGITLMSDMWAVSDSRKAYSAFMEVTTEEHSTIAALQIVNTFNQGELR